ncbi:MAG: acyl-CoA dehydrogenase family protein [Pseudomonadota bacterium]
MIKKTSHPLVQKAIEFAGDRLRPIAAQIDTQGGVPADIVQVLADEGFLGSVLPRDYGGGGVSAYDYGLLTEAIGAACSNTRVLLTVHTSLVGETIAKLGTEEQKQRFLPAMCSGKKIACFSLSEPLAGSDALSISTSYQEDDDGFVINGSKKWISMGAIADLFLVFAANQGKINAFLVERSAVGVSTQAMSGLMASRGAHLAEVNFTNVRVARENLLGRPGMGFTFVANTALYYGRFSIAWAGVAIARAALEEMVTYARTREQFGKKISQHQLIQALIADSTVDVHSARAFCENIAHMRDAKNEDAVMETNIAKLYTSRIATQVANNAVQVLGGNGLWQAYAAERLYREARVLEIIEGTTQVQQLMVANHALRHYFKPELRKQYPV